jgi:hypothetical protein
VLRAEVKNAKEAAEEAAAVVETLRDDKKMAGSHLGEIGG